MDITNRAVFIAGATSGIGLELARRFAAAGSTVIVGGRRTDLLDKLAADGFATVPIDVTDAGGVDRARDTILRGHPSLDTIVTMSGVMIPEDLRDPARFSAAKDTIDTNLLGTFRVIDAFIPHLIGRGSGTIITVSSASGSCRSRSCRPTPPRRPGCTPTPRHCARNWTAPASRSQNSSPGRRHHARARTAQPSRA